MTELATVRFSEWESFYVVVGSSGAALIGMQFIVMTLIAERRRLAASDSLHAFGTPTVTHLAGALVISAIMSAPWPTLGIRSFVLAACGICGVVYGVIVIRRARRQTSYHPVWQDWIWYQTLPCAAYAALTLAAIILRTRIQTASFVIAAAALGLLLIGVHNAWDTVTHIVMTVPTDGDEKPDKPRRPHHGKR